LTGIIPPELGNLNSLQHLYLYNNQLTGSIPSEIGNLTNLTWIVLSDNQLTGSIPAEIGNLTNLQELRLGNNQLTGSIPTQFGNLTNLQHLSIYGNQLMGTIPESLKNLTQISYGDIRWNALYTDDTDLRDFLYTVQTGGDWESTQTVAPVNLVVGTVSNTTVDLSWTVIPYTGNSGRYEIEMNEDEVSSFALAATTADKSTGNITISGLAPDTTYNFRVRTVTDSHSNNQNIVYSEYTDSVSATTNTDSHKRRRTGKWNRS